MAHRLTTNVTVTVDVAKCIKAIAWVLLAVAVLV